ncbi:hypothetical protein ACH4OX_29535 [Streptomyces roseolus]|uniref:hypothetical protein n=1 Tax=Streptomyces roseolus TaxID=67358 RepID=UPI0037B3D7BD
MYLVHARLRRPADNEPFPWPARAFLAAAAPEEGMEHATVHHLSDREAVVGLFVRLGTLAASERAAAALCARVLSTRQAADYALVSCEAVLVWPFVEP